MMKVLGRVTKQKIREMLDIDAIACQLQERYLEKKKKLYFTFVDLKKTFDRVPQAVVKWTMRKLGVNEWLIRTFMAMYKNSNSVIRINSNMGEKFCVRVGVHQGSVVSSLLFFIVKPFRENVKAVYFGKCCMLVILEETGGRYAAWKNCMEIKRFRLNLAETKMMISGINQGPIFTSGVYPCEVCCKVAWF